MNWLYKSVGAAVVASRWTVYDDCCAEACGILADGVDERLAALELLIRDPEARVAMVRRAQEKLERDYSIGRLREQVLDVIAQVHSVAERRQHEEQKVQVLVS